MKGKKALLNAAVFFVLSGSAPIASAHLPVFDDGTAVDPEHALYISDIGLSQVVYHEVNEMFSGFARRVFGFSLTGSC